MGNLIGVICYWSREPIGFSQDYLLVCLHVYQDLWIGAAVGKHALVIISCEPADFRPLGELLDYLILQPGQILRLINEGVLDIQARPGGSLVDLHQQVRVILQPVGAAVVVIGFYEMLIFLLGSPYTMFFRNHVIRCQYVALKVVQGQQGISLATFIQLFAESGRPEPDMELSPQGDVMGMRHDLHVP